MSVEAMAWALNVPVGGSLKVVLLGLANHAAADGSRAYPAVQTLSRYAHVDRRTVQRCLRRLEADGWIVQTRSAGAQSAASYQLQMSRTEGRQNAAPVTSEGRQNAAPGAAPVSRRGDTTVLEGATPTPPEPSRTINEPSIAAAARVHTREADGTSDVAEPTSGESVDELVAWLAGKADYFGGSFGEALSVSAAQLRSVLEQEKPAVRLEVVRWLAGEAPTWSASTLAAALSRRGPVLKRARRDAARAKPAARTECVLLEQDAAALEVSKAIAPQLAAALSHLDESLLDLWVWPLCVVTPSHSGVVVLGGDEHAIKWVRERLGPLVARALADQLISWEVGSTDGLVPLADHVAAAQGVAA